MIGAILTTPYGSVALHRRPIDKHGDLQAFDGADRLLLDTLAIVCPDGAMGRVLVVGDNFGALAVSLRSLTPTSWSDSAVTHLATQSNLAAQGEPAVVRLVVDDRELVGPFDTVIWRIPRAVRVFRYQAAVLQTLLTKDAIVLAGGMDKHLPPDARVILEGLGSVQTHPGARKAHAFEVHCDAALARLHPLNLPIVEVPEHGLTLHGGHQSFSPDRVDLGARVMASALAALPPASRLADLCCGSGILGIVAQRHQPTAAVHYFDESFSAVETTRVNVAANVVVSEGPEQRFHWTDGMHTYDGDTFDAIICNPPFHQDGAVTDAVSWHLFNEARDHLAPGGQLWVVGNRHLGYHLKLRRLFGNCTQVASHPKFVVLAAERPRAVRANVRLNV